MTFFNRKEEVLEIKLTPYGRYLLSTGEFKPVHYSFFDDDVTYDSEHISYPEGQSETEGRIKETPRSHIQTMLRERQRVESVYAHDEKKLQNQFEKDYTLRSKLGNTDYYSNYAPAWDIDVLKGSISNIVTTYSGSGPIQVISQMNMSSSAYQPIVGNLTNDTPRPLYDEALRDIAEYEDNTFLEIRKDFILLEVNEENTTFQKGNFEIELFEIDEFTEGATTVELLTPLKFSGPSTLNKEYMDYFFNLDVDQEIDARLLCKYKGVDSTKGLFLQRTFECVDDATSGLNLNQYDTNAPTEDICD